MTDSPPPQLGVSTQTNSYGKLEPFMDNTTGTINKHRVGRHVDSLIIVFVVFLAAVVLILEPVSVVLASGQHDDVPSIVEMIH